MILDPSSPNKPDFYEKNKLPNANYFVLDEVLYPRGNYSDGKVTVCSSQGNCSSDLVDEPVTSFKTKLA